VASNLEAGIYTVTVTDANSCTATSTITLTEPPTTVTISNVTPSNVSCNGDDNGSIDIEVTDGIAPYTYLWSESSTTQDLSGLSPDTYTVTVSDANNCTTTTSVTITEPTALVAEAGTGVDACSGDSTPLTASATGGTMNYSYAWSTSETTASITVTPLVTTTYTVTITDANNCTAEDQITVTVISCTEICDDGIDNDGDGQTDCDDSDCQPLANPAILNVCDNSNSSGQGTFFLHDANPTVTTESGVMISYHATLTDAQAGINTLTSPYNSNDATVYARVERISTGCFATSNITLDVGAKCAENCENGIDDDGDGLIDCDDPDCPCCDAYAPTLNGLNKKDP
jgi:hypothetical protein